MSSSPQRNPDQILRIALCQIPVCADKRKNIATARSYITRAKSRGAALAILPECFNCPYDTAVFREYAEIVPGPGTIDGFDREKSPSVAMLQDAARESGMFVVGGSIPETGDGNRIYNTSVSVAPTGEIVAKHRKVHLFDIDCSATGGIKFKESDALSAGNETTLFTVNTGLISSSTSEQVVEESARFRIGIGICYDIRFPELSMSMARDGCADLLIFPGAFNMTTGPAHWELLARARAVDNQVFVAVCSPARWDENASYTPWGHSTVVDPWGTVIATTEHDADLLLADLALSRIEHVRSAIPTSQQRRPDVYSINKIVRT